MRELKKSKIIIGIILLISISVVLIKSLESKNEGESRDILVKNLQMINDEANSVYQDIEASEMKYLALLEAETDPFKRGMYSSALVQVYTVYTDFDKIDFYANQAIKEYKKVPDGEYYAIAESKYLAFSMMGMGLKAESFIATNSLLEMLNSSGKRILNDEEIMDTEVVIYTILLSIYSEFDVLDMAEIYYKKLSEMVITPEIYISRGDKIAYSKFSYAMAINDLDLINKYAYECYDLMLERDKERGTNTADSVILNVVDADIISGNLDNVMENIIKAHNFFNSLKGEQGITYVYKAYSDYYEKIGDLDKSDDYHKKSIDKAEELRNDHLQIEMIQSYISFLEKYDLHADENIEGYYRKYYYLVNEKKDQELTSLLSEILRTNEELNNSRLIQVEKEALQVRKSFISAAVMILILGVMLVIMAYSIKKKNITEKKLEEIANKDYLTSVNTRAYGNKIISNLIKNKVHFSLALFDIDNFKGVNDTFGHVFGDKVLKTIADKVKEEVNKEDIVIRFGGEEFIVIFVGCTSIEAKEKLDKIREDINNIIFDNEVRVSISAGIKEWDNTNIEDVIDEADKLLYKAKKEGKNKVKII
ncbi:GGDEF domain-containing protein [Clostridium paraputrificum]|uniref:GGDEF domain-containing protein n=1 Tax=Clostridium paraputrificum TaxID=29363 RepID=UPI003D345C7D